MQIKRVVTAGIIGILAVVTMSFAELKVGYISSEKIFLEYEGTKSAQNKFNKEVAMWEQQATEMQKEIKDLKEQLDKQSLLLSSERKKQVEEQLQQKMVDYQKFLQEKFGQQGEALKKNEDLTRPIIERINIILDQIAKAENYDYILDTRSGGVVFARDSYDLTERVLQELNKEK
ncbi:MAG: OmpH family outer membrane protein [Fibrobacterota bacterium]